MLLQADVNANDEEDDDDDSKMAKGDDFEKDPEKGLAGFDQQHEGDDEEEPDEKTPLKPSDEKPVETSTPQKLYPTAPAIEESDDSTASAHSTSV